MCEGDPHLSIIAVSRNDDHGGNMLNRMQPFVDGFIAQCRKHNLRSELILVEWNPPSDRPSLEQALSWPDDFGPATVRIVTVPPEVHAQFPHADALPLFQMIGKNVGIRRAHGRYVLATNIDILLDDAIVIYLRDQLRPGTLLRADRYDVPANLPKDVEFDRVLADCRNRFFQINTRFGILDVSRRRIVGMNEGFAPRLLALYSEIRIFGFVDPANRLAKRFFRCFLTGPLTLGRSITRGFTASWVALKRVPKAFGGAIRVSFWVALNMPSFFGRNFPKVWPLRSMPSRAYWYIRRIRRRIDPRIVPKRWLLRKVLNLPQAFVSVQRFFMRAWRLLGPEVSFRSRSSAQHRFARSQRLHTWACGDFTLAAQEDWFRLRGYPEWPMYSWHIDSAFMFAANAHEIREIALGPLYRIYHIDHSVGSGWSPEGEGQLFSRLRSRGIPFLTDDALRDWQNRAAENPEDVIINEAVWGLAWLDLPERRVLPNRSETTIAQRSVASTAVEA